MLKCDSCLRLNNQHILIEGGAISPYTEHENICCDNEQDIHMSSKNREERSYDLDLHLLSVLTQSHVHILGETW